MASVHLNETGGTSFAGVDPATQAQLVHPFDPDSILDMVESLASLALCIASGLRLVEPLSESALTLANPSHIFDFEPTWAPAGKAGIYACFKVVPNDRYRSLLAAIVKHHDADVGVEFLHDWPVLFLHDGGDSRTIAEGGAVQHSGSEYLLPRPRRAS